MSDPTPIYSSDSLPPNIQEMINGHLEELRMAREKNSDLFEKQSNYIAGGTLSITPFLVDKILDIASASYKWLLFTGWSLVGLSLLVGLVGAYLASRWLKKSISQLTATLAGRANFNSAESNKRHGQIEWINLITLSTLILGILLFFTFITLNIAKMSDNKNDLYSPKEVELIKKAHPVSTLPSMVIQGQTPSVNSGSATPPPATTNPTDKTGN